MNAVGGLLAKRFGWRGRLKGSPQFDMASVHGAPVKLERRYRARPSRASIASRLPHSPAERSWRVNAKAILPIILTTPVKIRVWCAMAPTYIGRNRSAKTERDGPLLARMAAFRLPSSSRSSRRGREDCGRAWTYRARASSSRKTTGAFVVQPTQAREP